MQDAVHANRLHNVTRRIKPQFTGLFFHNDITIVGQIAQKNPPGIAPDGLCFEVRSLVTHGQQLKRATGKNHWKEPLCCSKSGSLRDTGNQIEHLVGVAPLVVVPGNHFDKRTIQLDASTGVEH